MLRPLGKLLELRQRAADHVAVVELGNPGKARTLAQDEAEEQFSIRAENLGYEQLVDRFEYLIEG